MRLLIVGLVLTMMVTEGYCQKLRIPKFFYDTAYFVNYNDNLAVRVVSPQRLYNFSIKNKANGEKYGYSPNLRWGFGIGFTFRWLAVDFTFAPKFSGRDVERFGETKQINFTASAYLERSILNLNLRNYKGMYATNPEDFIPDWSNDQVRPQRPDVATTSFELDYSIPFNWKRYSLRSTMLMDGRLKKSAGSFMTISSFYYYNVRADSSLLPQEHAANFPPEADITRMNIAMFSQAAGYSHTFVYKRLLLTLSAFPAISFNFGNVYSEAGKYSPKPVSFKLSSVEGLGANFDRWYAGLYIIFDTNQTPLPYDLKVSNNVGGWRIFVGYRIRAPKVVREFIN